LLQTLVHDGYEAFAQSALEQRAEMKLPPFCYFVLFRAESVTGQASKLFLNDVKTILQADNKSVDILGPIEAPIEKRQGRYRWQLLLRAEKRSQLHQLLKNTLPQIEMLKSARKTRWSVDVDPIDML
jgi:primosomal protein N' (replication factor Y)